MYAYSFQDFSMKFSIVHNCKIKFYFMSLHCNKQIAKLDNRLWETEVLVYLHFLIIFQISNINIVKSMCAFTTWASHFQNFFRLLQNLRHFT